MANYGDSSNRGVETPPKPPKTILGMVSGAFGGVGPSLGPHSGGPGRVPDPPENPSLEGVPGGPWDPPWDLPAGGPWEGSGPPQRGL